MALLFPHVLRLSTPYGLVDLAGYEVPPEALATTVERPADVLTLMDGAGVARFAEKSTLTRLKLASPPDFGLPYASKRVLAKCIPGTVVTITENLTDRERLTVWTEARVSAAPVLSRLFTDTDASEPEEYYSYSLEFIHTEASA